MVLELSAGSQECIAQRDICILMGVIGRMRSSNRDLLTGYREIDPDVVQRSLVLMMLRWLDDNVTAHDMSTELVETRGELSNAGLERRRGLHVAKRDL